MNKPTYGDELWMLHTGMSTEGLSQLINLNDIPPKMKEIERKYRLSSTKENTVDEVISSAFARVGSLIKKRKLKVADLVTFVGIDQYYIFEKDGKEFHFRYRSGANRPPQLTVKYQLEKGSNLVRGEINVAVEHADPHKVRALMSVIAAMAGVPMMFVIQQSGQIWKISDPVFGKDIEIVVYRVRRFVPDLLEAAFIEIEPIEFPDASEALMAIKEYERELGLKSFLCRKSIAELFRPVS